MPLYSSYIVTKTFCLWFTHIGSLGNKLSKMSSISIKFGPCIWYFLSELLKWFLLRWHKKYQLLMIQLLLTGHRMYLSKVHKPSLLLTIHSFFYPLLNGIMISSWCCCEYSPISQHLISALLKKASFH